MDQTTDTTPTATEGTSPRIFSGGTRGRPKIFLLEDWTGTFGSKLPKLGDILSRLMQKISEDPSRKAHSNPSTVVTKVVLRQKCQEIADEVTNIWRHAMGARLIDGEKKNRILISKEAIVQKLAKFFETWRRLEQDSRTPTRKFTLNFDERCNNFKNSLIFPWDISRPDTKNRMRAAGVKDWEEDFRFLQQQLTLNQPGSIGGLDTKQLKRDIRKVAEAQRLQRQQKNQQFCGGGDDGEEEKEEEEEDNYEEGDNEDNSPAKKRRRGRKFNIMKATSLASDGRNISVRDQMVLAASTCKALGVDVRDTNINKTSAHRWRKRARQEKAKEMRDNFSAPEHCSLHWDGKILPMKGTSQKSGRVAVVVKGIDEKREEFLLAVPEAAGGTGKEEAETVIKELRANKIEDTLSAISFDTTATNTGAVNGACKIIEEHLGRPVLWLACRHHIAELVARKVFEVCMKSSTQQPGVPLFTKFQKEFVELQIEDLTVLNVDELPPYQRNLAKEVLTWAEDHLSRGTFPREDYRELLELSIVCLGGKVENFKMRKPGADHHARWMSKIIYSLKIFLVRSFQLEEEVRAQNLRFIKFALLVYIKHWFTVPVASAAPSNDLEFIKVLTRYREVDKLIAFEALTKFRNHLWYVNPRLAVIALADSSLPDGERMKICSALRNSPQVEIKNGKPIFPDIPWTTEGTPPPPSGFITSESHLIFQILKMDDMSWLQTLESLPCSRWDHVANYQKFARFVNSLSVTNDVAERAIALITQYMDRVRNEDERQDLLLNVSHWRKSISDLNKTTLCDLPT